MRAMILDRSRRYGVSVGAAVAAFTATDALRRVGHTGSFSLFVGAVLISAWYGGIGPGTVTLVISMAGASVLAGARGGHADMALRLGVLIAVSCFAVVVGCMARRAPRASAPSEAGDRGGSEREGALLAMVSEELRTPIDSLLMQVEMMAREAKVPPGVREELGEVRKRIDLEMRLLDDLTDLSAMDRGNLTLAMVRTNLHDAVQEAAQACEVEVLEKRIELNVRFTATRSHVMGDPEKMEQLFWNLIYGVTRVVPSGGAIDVVTSDGSDGRVSVRVSGRYVAIDPVQVSSLVHLSGVSGVTVNVSRFDGLSFGLAVCEALTHALGGTIAAGPINEGKGVELLVSFQSVENIPGRNGDGFAEVGQTRVVSTEEMES